VNTAQLVAHAADEYILCVSGGDALFPNYFGEDFCNLSGMLAHIR